MIDPAILRPGRLDVKIKIERPDAEAARDIFSKYLTADLPLHDDDVEEHGGDRNATVAAMIQRTVERMYSEIEENRFLEVTYANGDKEILYFKDFNSGAMIQNIVDRAKKMAIKDFLDLGQKGHPDLAPARRLRRRVQGERGPAEHDQPRRLGPDLGQEGRADRLHPHAHPGQAGHRGRPLHRHRRQHRPVPVGAVRPAPVGTSLHGAGGHGRRRESRPVGRVESAHGRPWQRSRLPRLPVHLGRGHVTHRHAAITVGAESPRRRSAGEAAVVEEAVTSTRPSGTNGQAGSASRARSSPTSSRCPRRPLRPGGSPGRPRPW